MTPNGMERLEAIRIGGIDQRVSVRGADRSNQTAAGKVMYCVRFTCEKHRHTSQHQPVRLFGIIDRPEISNRDRFASLRGSRIGHGARGTRNGETECRAQPIVRRRPQLSLVTFDY